jgi:hypothetical protein
MRSGRVDAVAAERPRPTVMDGKDQQTIDRLAGMSL